MIFAIITLLTALSLASVAAWFSIVGLMAIFAGATIPILIMGSVLEVGKLITASWLYQNWHHASIALKAYLTSAVIILMFITSMGIFGYLSKAHLEQGVSTGNNIAKIERIDQRITREQREIVDAENVIDQLDNAVTTLTEYDKISGPTGAIAVRRAQTEDRQSLKQIIDTSQVNIDAYEDEKFQLNSAVREFELEVGPIRYVAELIYDDSKENLESTVRWVIIILVLVFDPLAVLLLIAANNSLMQNRTRTNINTKKYKVNINKPIINETKIKDDMELSPPAEDEQYSKPDAVEFPKLQKEVLQEGPEQKVKIHDEITPDVSKDNVKRKSIGWLQNRRN